MFGINVNIENFNQPTYKVLTLEDAKAAMLSATLEMLTERSFPKTDEEMISEVSEDAGRQMETADEAYAWALDAVKEAQRTGVLKGDLAKCIPDLENLTHSYNTAYDKKQWLINMLLVTAPNGNKFVHVLGRALARIAEGK